MILSSVTVRQMEKTFTVSKSEVFPQARLPCLQLFSFLLQSSLDQLCINYAFLFIGCFKYVLFRQTMVFKGLYFLVDQNENYVDLYSDRCQKCHNFSNMETLCQSYQET